MGRQRDAAAGVRRVVVALVDASGGQRAFEREVGVGQATLSRFLGGGRLTPGLARALFAAFPVLRPRITEAAAEAVLGGMMRDANADGASIGGGGAG